LGPQVNDQIRPVDDTQTQLINNVEIYHIRVKVRPELNVVGC